MGARPGSVSGFQAEGAEGEGSWVSKGAREAETLLLAPGVQPPSCHSCHPPHPTRSLHLCLERSGFNLGAATASGVLGGVAPLVITAISDGLARGGVSPMYVLGWWSLVALFGTICGAAGIRLYAPHCMYKAGALEHHPRRSRQ